MNRSQWMKKLKKCLSPLSKEEKARIAEYYDEMYLDKQDAGATESQILREFGSPESAAERFLQEYRGTQPAKKKNTVGRFFLAAVLFIFVGIPLLIVFAALAVAGAAIFLSGFAAIAAGIAYFVYFVAQMCMYGGSGAYIAHLGIGLAAVGVGCILVPLFLFLTKKLFILCGKLFVFTGRFIRGKREAY